MKKLLQAISDHNILLEEIKLNKQELIRLLQNNGLDGLHQAFVDNIPAAPAQPCYPLSSAQRRLWVLSRFEQSNAAYNNAGDNRCH